MGRCRQSDVRPEHLDGEPEHGQRSAEFVARVLVEPDLGGVDARRPRQHAAGSPRPLCRERFAGRHLRTALVRLGNGRLGHVRFGHRRLVFDIRGRHSAPAAYVTTGSCRSRRRSRSSTRQRERMRDTCIWLTPTRSAISDWLRSST